VSYLSVTAHYFDGEMNLRSCILDDGSLDERKTVEVLAMAVEDVVKEFGLDAREGWNKLVTSSCEQSSILAQQYGVNPEKA